MIRFTFTPAELEENKQRFKCFNLAEVLMWGVAPSYKTLFYSTLAIGLLIPESLIFTKIWNYVQPVPSPFDMSWGRKSEFKQFIYLIHNGQRIAKTEIQTEVDDYTMQPVIELVTEIFFLLPGALVPIFLIRFYQTRIPNYMICCLTAFDILIVRCFKELFVLFFRLIVSPDFQSMYEESVSLKMSFTYVVIRHIITYLPACSCPLLIWVFFSLLAHYRCMFRDIEQKPEYEEESYFYLRKLKKKKRFNRSVRHKYAVNAITV
uniref:Uncharacterized protein n=1 Tax=Panagrolaimus sp. JU765 TaxID=591449 RepID=A0AC34RBR0_9BILA